MITKDKKQRKTCPTCEELLVFPRNSYSYCEDCGWPNEDFGGVYGYPEDGDELANFQPHLEFLSNDGWVQSGVVFSIMRNHHSLGMYRYKF